MRNAIIYILMGTFLSCEMTPNKEGRMQDDKQNLVALQEEVVAFYNVENLFDLEDDPNTDDDDFTPNGEQKWTAERYQHKLNQLAKVLFKMNEKAPMLIGLVEIENKKVVEDLAHTGGLTDRKYKVAHYDSEDHRGIDCALLYDQSRMQLIDQEKIVVRLPNNSNYTTRDILYVKGKLHNDEIIHVFVNHWSSRRGGVTETEPKRLRAAEVLKEKTEEIRRSEKEPKILIMGDFNDEPKDYSLQKILGASGKKGDFSNLMFTPAKNGEGTIVHEREWYMFDQLIVTHNLLDNTGLRVKNKTGVVFRPAEIIYTYKNGGQKPNSTYGGPEYYGGFSDHLPVYLILEQ